MVFQFKEIVFAILALCWVVLLVAFIQARPWARMHVSETRPPETKWGSVLIAAGLAIIFLPFAPAGPPKSASTLEIAIGLSVLSFLLCLSAMIGARKARWMPEGAIRPQPLRTGSYQLVRHPVYTSLILLALATACAVSWWLWMFAGMFFVILGIDLRATGDDLLLADIFQEEFPEIQSETKSYIPFLH